MNNVEALIDILKKGAREIQDDLDEGGDWDPQFLCSDKTGKLGMALIDNYRNDQEKDIIVAGLAKVIELSGATACAMLNSTWGLSLDPADPGTGHALAVGLRPSEHPARVEQLMIFGLSSLSDQVTFSFAIISRTGGKPTLGEWKDQDLVGAKGAMIDPLMEAIHKNREEVIKH